MRRLSHRSQRTGALQWVKLYAKRISLCAPVLGVHDPRTLSVKQFLLCRGAIVNAVELEAEGLGLILRIGDADHIRRRVFVASSTLGGNNGVLIELVLEQGSHAGKHTDAHGGSGEWRGLARSGGRRESKHTTVFEANKLGYPRWVNLPLT